MSVLIKGIGIAQLVISKDEATRLPKVSGSYQLISNTDVVLATQPFNDYSGLKVSWSADTQKSAQDLLQKITSDLELLLGMKGGE
jgi:hypothetical protein